MSVQFGVILVLLGCIVSLLLSSLPCSALLRLPLPLQYAFNLFSHNSSITDTGYNEEEMKLVKETRKIWVRVATGELVVVAAVVMAVVITCNWHVGNEREATLTVLDGYTCAPSLSWITRSLLFSHPCWQLLHLPRE